MPRYGPQIVNDGLVFAVDAANTKSYDGVSVTTTDLINGITGTLTNGVTFSSSNSGVFVLDGINDYIEFGNLFTAECAANIISIDFWIKLGDISTDPENNTVSYIISKWNSAGGADKAFALSFLDTTPNKFKWNTGEGDTNNYQVSTPAIVNENEWTYGCVTHDGTLGSDYATMYINGNVVAHSVEIDISGNIGNSNEPVAIGAGNAPIGRYMLGGIGQVRIYNRVLTATEVLQNYDAIKNRFL